MKQELKLCEDCLTNVSLKNYNTFRIGGVAKYLVAPKDEAELLSLLQYLLKERIPYFILGNGSNVIFSDSIYEGVIIRLNHFQEIVKKGDRIFVGSGVMMPRFAMAMIEESYCGFEWAVGIPGTVGGCVYGNAEAYKESTFDHLISVKVITPNLEIKELKKEELSFGYRTSFFKTHPGYVILGATFKIIKGNKNESLEIIEKRMKKRKSTQPLEFPSAGSVFRNPSAENPSGMIIENCGLKGTIVGGAKISEKHANFIINTGNATSKDVRNLIELVHEEVKRQCNIDLVLEQEYVGWDSYETEGK